jgi:hypothetical protein
MRQDNHKKYAALCASATVLSLGLLRAEAGDFKAGVGVDYTSGDYGGAETINQTYVPFKLAYRTDRLGLRVTAPYVAVSGPGTVLDSSGELIPGPDESRSGLGDIILGATLYDVVRIDSARLFVDLGVKMKLGTASETDGLGTGESDYSFQADVLKELDRFSLFATAGYKWRGDPVGVDLRNVPFGTIGGDYRLEHAARVGLMFDYRPSALAGGDPLREATAYLSFTPRVGMTMQPYLVGGLSDSSPDWGGGLNIGWAIQSR